MGEADTTVLFRYRGRDLTSEDLVQIRAAIDANYSRGRSYISRCLCKQWDWRQANGRIKEYAARDLLLRLEEAGHIELPPRLRVKNNHKSPSFERKPAFELRPLGGQVNAFPAPELREAHGEEAYLWDYLIVHHHYLGNPKLVGEHLKQLIYLDGQVVGCLGWASAAFKVADRDRWIGWSQEARRCRLHLLANNVRFILLPWVRVKHLASKVLAQSVRGLSAQWEARYGHALVLAETFVETGRFAATCYRAANWQAVGQSRGHAKQGNRYRCHGVAKAHYLYPLRWDWRSVLVGEAPARQDER
ncbi:MAG: Druantia anti-phage system protein DruA [Candidatus Tectomicrobia bacterium]